MTKPGLVDVWPLSPLQQGMLFHARYEEQGTDVYVIQMTLDLHREVDEELLRQAVRTVLDRHDNLRASFRDRKSGEAVQVILRSVDPEWHTVDLAGDLDEVLAEDRTRKFDLAKPPIRFTLIRLAPDEYRFVLTAHHILLDGWSMPLVLGELMELYNNSGDASALPPVVVVGRNVLRNALVNPLTVLGLRVGYLLGGAVVIETMFALPGMGQNMIQAVLDGDVSKVQGFVITIAVGFVLVNLIVDVLYLIANPRLRSHS
ncbi:condensation domain-containing protein [Kibdelosporangium lantanae]|uniref:Condensation domain-containing protein n=1 Tax=Kibdelosporangium lantanae TaxID=1497396 RepID=A0ABW3MA80_9PSEU